MGVFFVCMFYVRVVFSNHFVLYGQEVHIILLKQDFDLGMLVH